MKIGLLYLICLTIGINSYAQKTKAEEIIFLTDQMNSIDLRKVENEFLNNNEGSFLNKTLDDKRNGYDLRNKKIGFISGTAGTEKHSKLDYFKYLQNSEQTGSLILFNDIEKKKYNYAGAIIYWSKISPTKKSIIRTLKKKINNN